MRMLLFIHFSDCCVKSDGFLEFFFALSFFTFKTIWVSL